MRDARFPTIGLLAAIIVAATGFLALRPVAAGDAALVKAAAQNNAPLCRYGVNVISGQTFTDHDVSPLRIGWYLNYRSTANTDHPSGVEFVPVIRLSQTSETEYSYTPNGAALKNAILAHPGARWLIGNEPDRRTSIQDNVEPHIYAAAYHELYQLIKQTDPTARIVAGTIVQPTPLRLRYLDMVLASYHQTFSSEMPVDGWSIHNFILNEVSCSYDPANCWGADVPPGIDEPYGEMVGIDDNDNFNMFAARVVRFRQWMKDRGYSDKPLYLSEYGILMPPDYGFDAARVNAYMNKTFDYLTTATDPVLGYPADGHRLVQKWSWYSVTDQNYNGWLFDSSTHQMTAMGQNFAAHTAAIAAETDLTPWRLTTNPGSPFYQGQPLSIQLTAHVANSGNLAAASGPAIVRFYKGNPAQGGQKIGSDQVVNLSGCGSSAAVNVTWNGAGAGTHAIYVVVDAGNTIAETNEANNTQAFTVLVGTHQAFMPRITR
ncbi:MAG: hypothetical protein KA586_05995 [Candidatus Promineofilum sp.]|nr:hypothetical protein [Promineifilum sp.]